MTTPKTPTPTTTTTTNDCHFVAFDQKSIHHVQNENYNQLNKTEL
eukprot:gene558-8068_t